MSTPTWEACALCGHDPSCGSATVSDIFGTKRLCHAEPDAECSIDARSCYVRWTVYQQRPSPPKESR